eukprot:15466634-Alexandrium_andersonii.AAC.1
MRVLAVGEDRAARRLREAWPGCRSPPNQSPASAPGSQQRVDSAVSEGAALCGHSASGLAGLAEAGRAGRVRCLRA